MPDHSEEILKLLERWRNGSGDARDRLVELVYDDLRQLAHARMRDERRDHTLDATALVHEVYLRLSVGSAIELNDRTHLLAVAATVTALYPDLGRIKKAHDGSWPGGDAPVRRRSRIDQARKAAADRIAGT